MATLTEHTMLNGLEENLRSAIEYAGGNIPDNTCVWMYPDIIRNQLNGGSNVNLIAGDGINIIKDNDGNFVISSNTSTSGSTNTEHITVDAIDAPEYSGISTWPEGTILQDLLEDLFYKVIPKIPSIVKGDVIITDSNGRDQYAPDPESYIDSLRPNTPYLRIFIASQSDPVYISMEKLIGIGGNGVIDLSNYYTIDQIDSKLNAINKRIDDIEVPEVDLKDYYTKEEVDAKIDSIEVPEVDLKDYYTKEEVDAKIDSIEVPEVDLSNYYTKSDTESLVDDKVIEAISNIDFPETDLSDYYTKNEVTDIINDSVKNVEIETTPDSEPITVVEVVEKVISQESQIQQVEQIVQNQSEQITQVNDQIQQVEQTIVQKVEAEAATVEDAHAAFDNIFEK